MQLILVVGTKLQHIIQQLSLETAQSQGVIGVGIVKVRDSLFWFNRPQVLLSLIHFILFQNSFELAFFLWILVSNLSFNKQNLANNQYTSKTSLLAQVCNAMTINLRGHSVIRAKTHCVSLMDENMARPAPYFPCEALSWSSQRWVVSVLGRGLWVRLSTNNRLCTNFLFLKRGKASRKLTSSNVHAPADLIRI